MKAFEYANKIVQYLHKYCRHILSYLKTYCQYKKPLVLLNKIKIQEYLTELSFNDSIKLHVLDSIDSTNNFLKKSHRANFPEVCVAETQTSGRGRFNRTWHSPYAENIYISLRQQLNCPSAKLSGLSIVIGLAIIKTLNDFDIQKDIAIKWPNDILWQGKKLAGILIEIINAEKTTTDVIIGIGLNVNSKQSIKLDQPWCSLHDITNKPHNRNHIIASLIININMHVTQYLKQGLITFRNAWEKADSLYQKKITVTHKGCQIVGTAHGITDDGLLIIDDDKGNRQFIYSGEASLKEITN